MCCEKCGKLLGVIVLVLGVIFLLKDLNIWNFWGISWWTVTFILGGLAIFCSTCCPTCTPKTTKKKK